MGLQVGEVVEIREEGARMPYPTERKYAAPASAGTPIQPGQIEVSAGVSIRFNRTAQTIVGGTGRHGI